MPARLWPRQPRPSSRFRRATSCRARAAERAGAQPVNPGDAAILLLIYELATDYLERRAAFRAEHLALAWAAHARGDLVLAGALADPVDAGLLLFQGESPAPAEAFARADPCVRHGLVTGWRVRPWSTVVGAAAATPVRPVPPEAPAPG